MIATARTEPSGQRNCGRMLQGTRSVLTATPKNKGRSSTTTRRCSRDASPVTRRMAQRISGCCSKIKSISCALVAIRHRQPLDHLERRVFTINRQNISPAPCVTLRYTDRTPAACSSRHEEYDDEEDKQ